MSSRGLLTGYNLIDEGDSYVFAVTFTIPERYIGLSFIMKSYLYLFTSLKLEVGELESSKEEN